MILTPHLLLGAVIGNFIQNIPLAILVSFISHYFLDFFPHIEYSIKNITEKKWKNSILDLIKIFLDFLLGIILIYLFSKNNYIIYICAFVSIIPDGLSMLNKITNLKILQLHSNFHQIKIHYFKNKRISKFWRFFTQVLTIIICILLLKI